eukprot:15476814-Alexandrium_andersonii.AAC.1
MPQTKPPESSEQWSSEWLANANMPPREDEEDASDGEWLMASQRHPAETTLRDAARPTSSATWPTTRPCDQQWW